MKNSHLLWLPGLVTALLFLGTPALAQTTWFVDEDAPGDPGPGDPAISDPLEDGTPQHPFDAIQEGINAATNADTILVLDGTYTGVGNRDIDFRGRLVTVRSQNGPETCVIELQGASGAHGFVFQTGETAQAVVDGFTVTHGSSTVGTGVWIRSSAPTVTRCVFSQNFGLLGGGGISVSTSGLPPTTITRCEFIENSGGSGMAGGGVFVEAGRANLVGCAFHGNSASRGGALEIYGGGNVSLSHCEFVQNTAARYGGAINLDGAGILSSVTNCLFIENVAGIAGGGIACWDRAHSYTPVYLYNCTFASNEADSGRCVAANTAYVDFFADNSILWEPGAVYVSGWAGFYPYFSDVMGYGGGSTIDTDPLYINPASRDYRLGPGSPCIDAASVSVLPTDVHDLDGDSDTSERIPVDLDWLPRAVDDPGTIDSGEGFPCVDMGAYEFHPAGTAVGAGPACGATPPVPAFSSVAPNPFHPRTTITIDLPRTGPVRLAVYDLRGRLVRTLWSGDMEAGRRGVTWDGVDDRGRSMTSGVYLLRLETPDGSARVVKLILTR